MQLENFFTYKRIQKEIIKKRLQISEKRRERHFLSSLVSNLQQSDFNPGNEDPELKELKNILPPRKLWIRPKLEFRRGDKDNKPKNSKAINHKSIELAINNFKKSNSLIPDWLNNLSSYVEQIQNRVLVEDSFQFKQVELIKILKEIDKVTGERKYRPLVKFQLQDRIILSLCFHYLVSFFDDYFEPTSYSFRKEITFDNGDKLINPSHHNAVKTIHMYCVSHQSQQLFVAECDLKKFFDTIHHDVVLKNLEKSINDVESLCNKKFDKRILKIIREYLNAYSFVKDALCKGIYTWVEEKEAKEVYGDNYINQPIGIPQGGAISCFIANLLLDSADKAIKSIADKDLLYIRYCDDMIIIHPDYQKCKKAFEVYLSVIKNLNLIPHPPFEIRDYLINEENCRGYKSKYPYVWECPITYRHAMPWISFLGYEIHWEGRMRIRQKSIEKEIEQQSKFVMKLVNEIKLSSGLKMSIDEIVEKANKKLTSRAVGKNIFRKVQHLCWTQGFKLLSNNSSSLKESSELARQLKKLDGHKIYQISKRLHKFISDLNKPILKPSKKIISLSKTKVKKKKNLRDYLHSYYRQFERTDK